MGVPASIVTGPDGRSYVPVRVGASRPFATALLIEWRTLDRRDRSWLLKQNAFSVPKDIYDAILPAVRRRLELQGVPMPVGSEL